MPRDKAINSLLVDFRTFGTRGGDKADRIHVGLGGELLEEPLRMYWGEGKDRKMITGVFSHLTNLKGAPEARDRLHLIGFVNERGFKPGAFGAAIEFVANPHIFKDADELKSVIDTWPLKPTVVLNGGES